MKKLLLVLLSVMLFTGCDDEPLGSGVTANNPDNSGGDTSDAPLALNSYSFDVNSEVPVFGTIIVNSDFFFNANNKAATSNIASTFFGQSATENLTFNRNADGKISGFTSSSGGVPTNETIVTYNGANISQIKYTFVQDATENYTYNFENSGNTIVRSEDDSTIATVFTFNGSNQLIKKESFDGATSIKKEVVDYDGVGNCISSVITGEDASTSSFGYDTNVNPLKNAFSDQYLVSFLNDDYSDDIGSTLAQFHSKNNWKRITTTQGAIDFTITYDANDRILTRDGNYDLGDGVTVEQNETFDFVN